MTSGHKKSKKTCAKTTVENKQEPFVPGNQKDHSSYKNTPDDDAQFFWFGLFVTAIFILVVAVIIGMSDFYLDMFREFLPETSQPEPEQENDSAVDFRELEPIMPMPKPQVLRKYCNDDGSNCVEMYP